MRNNKSMMMERQNKIVGLPVICKDNGKSLGIVKNIVYNIEEKRVKAIVVKKEGIKPAEKFLKLEAIEEFGEDAIIVKQEAEACEKVSDINDIEIDGITGQKMKEMKVYSRSGIELGVIKDVLFDCSTGAIEGVEVSDGLVEDLVKGRKLIPFIGNCEFGEDNLLVDRDALEETIDTGRGLIKRFMK